MVYINFDDREEQVVRPAAGAFPDWSFPISPDSSGTPMKIRPFAAFLEGPNVAGAISLWLVSSVKEALEIVKMVASS